MPQRIALVLLLTASLTGARALHAGTIGGTVTNPALCLGIEILVRNNRNPLHPKAIEAAYDPETGAFKSPELPEGTYALRLQIEGGVVEGIDMRVLPPDEGAPEPLTDDDVDAIITEITKPVSAYMDIHRPIRVRGHSKRAAAIVEVVRYRPAYGRPRDEITWGVELWYFENWTNVWVRPPGSRGRRRVFRRIRIPADMPKAEFGEMICLFDPDLGGMDVAEDRSVEGLTLTVPEPSVDKGKVAGSVEKQIEEARKKNAD